MARLQKFIRTVRQLSGKAIFFYPIFLGLSIVWIVTSKMETFAVAPGRILAGGDSKIVQSLEGGVIVGIYVTEGDAVTENQPLMEFSDLDVRGQISALDAELSYLALKKRSAESRLEGKSLEFSPDEIKRYPDLTAQLKQENKLSINSRSIMEEQVALSEEEYRISSKLYSLGLESRSQLLKSQSQVSERKKILLDQDREMRETLQRIVTEMAQKKESYEILTAKKGRVKVTAPTTGRINRILFKTLGAVAKPGEPLVEIVPEGTGSYVEVKVSTKDIAKISVGTMAKIESKSYDVSRYGFVWGAVTNISPTSTEVQNGETHFVVKVGRPETGQRSGGNLHWESLRPGMEVQARIKTGERSFLEYVFKPLDMLITNSFREG
jgi:adhesin transport system membrane fusion protein